MTDIEQKALALAIETRVDDRYRLCPDPTLTFGLWEALCRAIEQHEAFRQMVSDAVEDLRREWPEVRSHIVSRLSVFVLPKPDPLVEVLDDMGLGLSKTAAEEFRAAIKKRGGKIVWGEG